MLQSKIFFSSNPVQLEKEINLWLENADWVKVQNVTQSSNQDKLVITVWYQEPDVPIL